MDRRIAKVVDGITTYTLYDGDRPWADYDGGLSIVNRYLYSDTIDEILAKSSPSGELNCYLSDDNYTPRDIQGEAGALTGSQTLSAYGGSYVLATIMC